MLLCKRIGWIIYADVGGTADYCRSRKLTHACMLASIKPVPSFDVSHPDFLEKKIKVKGSREYCTVRT